MHSFQSFNQPPPALGNQFDDDRVLRSYLARILPEDIRPRVDESLRALGELAGRELWALQQADRISEPTLEQWDAWGERVDRVVLTRVWERARTVAAEHGVVATGYEGASGRHSRTHQFALAYLFTPSSDLYSCPLAMTDGAATTLLNSGNQALIERAVPHLTSRDPSTLWTSGQWMTESTGGSDVGSSESVARRGHDGLWRLYGRKWFTSAATSEMALTLARPEGNPAGGRGLALFYLETETGGAGRNGIYLNRLKDKLGTRKLPTAELMLEGTVAELVGSTDHGTRAISPMLNITRTWNSVSAVAGMRRGLALARDFAPRRVVFGAPLCDKPLHLDTLAWIQAEMEAAFLLTFRIVELLGAAEHEEIAEGERRLLRVLTPVAKLATGKQAVALASETLEAFGGAGYLEDTGLAVLLRDAQILPIWEGTTNVLSLDTLRALRGAGGLQAVHAEIFRCGSEVRDASLAQAINQATAAVEHADAWLEAAIASGHSDVEAGARRFAMTLGRAVALALLAEHAQWSIDRERDGRARAAARRFATTRIDCVEEIGEIAGDDSRALANDIPLPVDPAPRLQ